MYNNVDDVADSTTLSASSTAFSASSTAFSASSTTLNASAEADMSPAQSTGTEYTGTPPTRKNHRKHGALSKDISDSQSYGTTMLKKLRPLVPLDPAEKTETKTVDKSCVILTLNEHEYPFHYHMMNQVLMTFPSGLEEIQRKLKSTFAHVGGSQGSSQASDKYHVKIQWLSHQTEKPPVFGFMMTPEQVKEEEERLEVDGPDFNLSREYDFYVEGFQKSYLGDQSTMPDEFSLLLSSPRAPEDGHLELSFSPSKTYLLKRSKGEIEAEEYYLLEQEGLEYKVYFLHPKYVNSG